MGKINSMKTSCFLLHKFKTFFYFILLFLMLVTTGLVV